MELNHESFLTRFGTDTGIAVAQLEGGRRTALAVYDSTLHWDSDKE